MVARACLFVPTHHCFYTTYLTFYSIWEGALGTQVRKLIEDAFFPLEQASSKSLASQIDMLLCVWLHLKLVALPLFGHWLGGLHHNDEVMKLRENLLYKVIYRWGWNWEETSESRRKYCIEEECIIKQSHTSSWHNIHTSTLLLQNSKYRYS